MYFIVCMYLLYCIESSLTMQYNKFNRIRHIITVKGIQLLKTQCEAHGCKQVYYQPKRTLSNSSSYFLVFNNIMCSLNEDSIQCNTINTYNKIHTYIHTHKI